jgi:hypothetical protein
MVREEWLSLPIWIRIWRVLFCSHPFNKSEKIGIVKCPPLDEFGYVFVIHVRRCNLCNKFFIDSGMERES